MEHWFRVQHLDSERLLAEWRWLYPGPATLVARTAFGDLCLSNQSGQIQRLDVSVGKLTKIAESETEFRESLVNLQNREECFGETDERGFATKGLVPNEGQCIGFDPPLVFAGKARKPYLVDIYEHVSFLGNLNKQIADVPDGGKVRLTVGPPPLSTDH